MADENETTEVTESEETLTGKDAKKRTLTQEELDAIVESRLARERKKYADYDDLKAKAAQLDEIEAANLSELEKERTQREAAEARAVALQEQHDAEKIRSALISEAVKQGAKNAEAVLRAVDKTGVTLGDDGQVTGAGEAVKALLEEIPELVGGGSQSGDFGARGGGPGKITQAQLKDMSPAEVTEALKKGELSHLL